MMQAIPHGVRTEILPCKTWTIRAPWHTNIEVEQTYPEGKAFVTNWSGTPLLIELDVYEEKS